MYGLHIGPCRRAARNPPKRHAPERYTKIPQKTYFGGTFGGQGSQKGRQRGPEGRATYPSAPNSAEPLLLIFTLELTRLPNWSSKTRKMGLSLPKGRQNSPQGARISKKKHNSKREPKYTTIPPDGGPSSKLYIYIDIYIPVETNGPAKPRRAASYYLFLRVFQNFS